MNFISDSILRALCWALLHSLWQGLVLALLAGVILILTKKSSSSLRYNLLCCGMILFLAVNGYTFYHQLQTDQSAPAVPSLAERLHQSPAAAANGTPVIHPTVVTPPGHGFRDAIDALVQYFNTHAAPIVVIWFIFFLARFIKMLSGLVYAQRIRHYRTSPVPAEWQQQLQRLLHQVQISRPVQLLESALIKVPVVVGVLKPVILVPVGMLTHLSAQQVESILLHELAHIRRKDYLFNIVQHLVDTLFFFNPALVWISSLIRAERENCCDDIAIRETRSRRQLIEALVSFHEYRQSAQGYALSFAQGENQVVKRVKRIVHKTNHSLNAGERVLLMSGLMILSAAFITINGSREAMAPKKTIANPITKITSPASAEKPIQSETANPANPAKPVTKLPFAAKHEPIAADTTGPKQAKQQRTEPDKADTTAVSEGVNYLGYQHVSIDKLIECKEHGVTADFILSFRKLGYTDISLDQAIQLKDHGVTVDYIREIQSMGFNPISLDRAVELKDHGISPEFVNSFQSIGYGPVNLDKAVQLKDHGVSASFVKRINEMGFGTISLEKAIELKDHGVTIEFINAWKERTGKLLELNDYIKLRDAGINPRG